MQANQQMIASDGYEVCLFPCEAMFLTQGEHQGYALDFRAVNAQGVRITKMPLYAPFTGTIVWNGNDHNCILQSNNKVHTPNGLKYVRVLVAHQEAAPPTVNSEFRQGFKWYETGNYADQGASFGEHLHMEYALVDNKSDRLWNTGGIGLYKGTHMWDSLYDNDTFLANDGNLDWIKWEGGVVPPTVNKKEKRFPWVLYARKFRHGRIT